MAVIDPRLEMARRARAAAVSSPNVVTLRQTLQQGIAAPKSTVSPDAARLVQKALSFQDVQNRVKALDIAQGRTASADKGLLGKVLDNPIAKTILKPLELLDVPRRVLVSGIKEFVVDPFGPDGVSWSDFINQAKDPTFGVGRFVHTGNKWVDRAIGFVGDVVTDPMTYVTLGGSKFAGASGRIALAEKVLLKSGDEALAKSVARYGRAALSAQQIAELDIKGLKQAGIYFMGKKVGRNGLIGRGSETLGSMGERTLNRLRFAASDTKMMKFVQNAFTTDVNREARLMLLRGEAPQGMAGNLIHIVNSRNAQRSAEGVALTEAQVAVAQMARDAGLDSNEVLSKRLTEVLQRSGPPPTAAEAAAAKRWRDWFDLVHGNVNEAMRRADPSAGFDYINDYVPLMYTEVAQKELGNPTSRFAGFIKKGMDDSDPMSVFEPRYLFKKIREDGSVDWFGTKLTADMLPSPQSLADGTALTIERLNKIARDAGFAGDVFETDLVKIANKYSFQYAAQMGIAAKLEDLVSKGATERLDSVYSQADELFDPEAVKAATERLAQHVEDTQQAHGALVEAIKNVREAVKQGGKMVEDRLSRAVGLTAEQTVAAQRHEVIAMIQSLTEPILTHLEKIGASSARVFDSTVEWAITSEMLDTELKRVTAEAQALSAEMMDAALNRYGVLSNAVEAQQLFNEYSGRLAELQAQAVKAQQQFATAVEMAPLIQARWDDIVAGRQFAASSTLTKEQASRLNAISKAAGFKDGAAATPLQIEGAFRDWLKAADGMQAQDWWKQINGVVDVALSANDVAKISMKDVPQMLRNITGGSLESVQPMRVAGAWLLAHDTAVFGGAMPNEALTAARAELINALSEAADSQLRAAQIGKIVQSGRRDAKALRVGSEALGQVQQIERSFRELVTQQAIAAAWQDGVWNPNRAKSIISRAYGHLDDGGEFAAQLLERVKLAGLNKDGDVSDRILELVDQATYKQERLLAKQHSVRHPDGYNESGALADYIYDGRLTVNSKDLSEQGYGQVAPVSTEARKTVQTPREAADRLAMAIERYHLQSDFTHRLVRATESMIQFGVAPTEGMARELFNAAARDGLERWTAQTRTVSAARDALAEIRTRFGNIITTPGWDGSRGVALRQAWREVSDTLPPDVSAYLDRAVLQFGDPSIMLEKMRERYWLNQPEFLFQQGEFDAPIRGVRPKETAQEFYDEVGKSRGLPKPVEGESAAAYRKRALEKIKYNPKKSRRDFVDEYYQSTVKPWYKLNYAGSAGKRKAYDALKERALMAQTKSPFRADAAQWEIEELFALLAGGEVRGSRTGMAVTRNRYMQQSERTRPIGNLVSVRGTLQEDYRLASDVSRALRLAADRNVDVDKFVADFAQGVKTAYRGQLPPSMFADTLRWTADRIENIDVKIAAAFEEMKVAGFAFDKAAAQQTEARSVAAQFAQPSAEEELYAAATAPVGRLRDARLRQASQRARSGVSDAVGDLPAGIDPSRVVRFRKLRARLQRLQATEDFVLAKADQERVDVLRRLAGVDGWKARVQLYEGGPSVEGWAISRSGESPVRVVERPDPLSEWGGTVSEFVPSLARDGNGNPIMFTQHEWESLFIDDATAASEAGRLRGEIGRINQQHKMIEARIEQLQSDLADSAAAATTRGGVPMSANKQKLVRRELRDLERKSKVIGDFLEYQRTMLRSMSPLTRKSAHEKLDALMALGDSVFGDKPIRASFTGGPQYHAGTFALGDSMVSNVDDRLARLESSWEASRSGRLLSEIAGIEDEMSTIGFDSMLAKAESRAQAAAELRASAETAYRNKIDRFQPPKVDPNGKNASLVAWQTANPPDSFGSLLDEVRRDLGRAGTVTAPGVDPTELASQLGAVSRQLEAGVKVGEMRQASGLPNYPSRMDTTPTRLRKAAAAADRIGTSAPVVSAVDPAVRDAAVSSTAQAFQAGFDKQMAGQISRDAQAAVAEADRALADVMARAKAAGREQEVLDSLLNGDGLGKLRVKTGTSGRSKTIKQVYGVSNLREAQVMFDSAQTFTASAEMVRSEVIPSIERQVEALKGLAASIPKTVKPDDVRQVAALHDAAKAFLAAMSDAAGPDIARVEALAKMADDLGDPMLRSLAEALRKGTVSADDPVMRTVASVIEASNNYVLHVDNELMARQVLAQLSEPRTVQKVSYTVRDGMESLKSLGFPGLQAHPEVKKMLSNMQQLEDPQFARLVSGFLGGYTKFFKGYATLSPGFHVRNALSNTFMLLASGAEVKNMRKGLRLYKSLMDHLESGQSFATWAESAAVKELTGAERESALLAARTMFGAGGGNTSEQLRGMLRDGQSWIMDNWALRKSSKVGQRVEGSARFMLAFDSAQQGMDLNGAMARVKRYLFDYQDVSIADKNMRAVVPFWLWMSRNLPLQLINQWTNPRMYAIYGAFARNIGQPSSSGDMLPSWMQEQGAIKVGQDSYLTPDLGFNRVQQQLAELGDIPRMASYLNPGLRVPVELLGNRQLYNDVPFPSTQQSPAAGPLTPVVQALAQQLGLTDTNAQGQQVWDPRWNYALRNMLPPVGQLERLMPSSEYGQQKVGNAWRGYLGIPFTQVTEGMKQGEIARRQREIAQLATAARSLGFQP